MQTPDLNSEFRMIGLRIQMIESRMYFCNFWCFSSFGLRPEVYGLKSELQIS